MDKKVCVSKGNSKIGQVMNVSRPAVTGCRLGLPCAKDCYARRTQERWKTVRDAWGRNMLIYQFYPESYFEQIQAAIYKDAPKLFRWHVSGDIPDQRYMDMMNYIAIINPDTKFLCFTKMYELDYRYNADNMEIVLSTWPGLELPNGNKKLRRAWLEEDPRKPETYLRCSGGCDDCDHACWSLSDRGVDVVFPLH